MPSKPTPWRNSPAKKLLTKDIIDGRISDDMSANRVFVMRPEFQLYKYANFTTNLRNLRKTVNKLQDLADGDEAAFAHDESLGLRVHNKPYPRWQGTVDF
jgi:hypothetical protein